MEEEGVIGYGCVVGSKTSFKERRRKRPQHVVGNSGKNAEEETGLLQYLKATKTGAKH